MHESPLMMRESASTAADASITATARSTASKEGRIAPARRAGTFEELPSVTG